MALTEVAQGYYGAQRSIVARVIVAVARIWAGLSPDDLSGSWARGRVGERLYVTTAQAQLLAVQLAERYVIKALAVQGGDPTTLGALTPGSLAGIVSDGRDLESLLFEPLITTKAAIGRGYAPDRALAIGNGALTRIVGTQVADAGRAATDVAMTARPAVTSWARMLVPPSCGRCAVLAGRVYRWSAGFTRHPLCDCVHVPSIEDAGEDLRADPGAYFRSLSADDQNRYFTVAGAQAIRDGADIGKVVNARRGASGLSQPGRLTLAEQRILRGGRSRGALDRVDVYGRQLAVTTEGVTVRGTAGRRLAGTGGTEKRPGQRYRSARTPRLMPEAIAEIADGDRDENIRLLRRFGYLT